MFLSNYILLLFIPVLQVAFGKLNNNNTDAQKAIKLPACAACKVLTDSFNKGIEETARGKFEGGDSAWEEEKMRSYKKSEVRLVEIQENLCQDIVRGQSQCHSNNEEHEGLIEDWWFKYQNEEPDLFKWLCIEKLTSCCPANHFGSKCLPCKGGIDNVCSGNGKCKGAGTRKGNGQCECKKGYRGELCNQCSMGHFMSYKNEDETIVMCDACNKACDGHCSGAGPKSCTKCKDGWQMDTDNGCLDINECVVIDDICKSIEFCVNREGAYDCLKCDISCDGCTGDGPDMCVKCSDGFELEDGSCIDKRGDEREAHLEFARYVTYAGLTVATCIIFQRNTVIAAVFGLFVASYISFSEYYLTHMSDNKNAPPPIDMSSSNFRRD